MRILGIDTTTKFLCLGLSDEKKTYEYNLDLGRRHSTLLVPTIKRVLGVLGWNIYEIDYFACGIGPGSFTGMRVGLATIKGLSWPFKKPIVGISSLDILARSVKNDFTPIVPAIDAKRNLIYCSIYKIHKGALKKIAPYMLLSEDEFLKRIPRNALVLGDASGLYKEQILKNIKGVNILDRDHWYPRGGNLIALAQERIKSNKLQNAFNIRPIYLYPKECQIRKVK